MTDPIEPFDIAATVHPEQTERVWQYRAYGPIDPQGRRRLVEDQGEHISHQRKQRCKLLQG